jgi:uncharacterized protein YaeQ
MALTATRFEYRISLSHVDRDRSGDFVAIAARHPSETHARLTLRVLARCLLDEDGLEFGPDISSTQAVDLWNHTLTGDVSTWIACGVLPAEKLRKVLLHHHGVHVHVVLDDQARAASLVAELAEQGHFGRGSHPPEVWTLDPDLVATLAENEARRQRWTVTIVGDHIYVDAEGLTAEGPIGHVIVSSGGKGM